MKPLIHHYSFPIKMITAMSNLPNSPRGWNLRSDEILASSIALLSISEHGQQEEYQRSSPHHQPLAVVSPRNENNENRRILGWGSSITRQSFKKDLCLLVPQQTSAGDFLPSHKNDMERHFSSPVPDDEPLMIWENKARLPAHTVYIHHHEKLLNWITYPPEFFFETGV